VVYNPQYNLFITKTKRRLILRFLAQIATKRVKNSILESNEILNYNFLFEVSFFFYPIKKIILFQTPARK